MPDEAPSAIPAYAAGLLRQGISMLAGYLVAKGVVSQEQAPEIVGGGLVVISAAWSWYQKASAQRHLKAAIAAPAGQAK